MDWLKLFALLVAVASVQITAEGPKKKIRIHLPQKVKHIHHHKKIYITNHPAPSQYAPAYLSGVKGALPLPSNVARPAVANFVPLNSVELFDESRQRLQGVAPAAASKLLPLYRARGHYGPNHSEWDEQEYDLAPPPQPTDIYAPSAYPAPTVTSAVSANRHVKRIKLVKVNELPRKKVIRKVKPKRVYVRGRPQAQPHSHPHSQQTAEDEHPVSSFHEHFYADLEESGTIRKVRKPPRIEKIIDGDTEHIHTYSEEHIHKVVFDDDSKLTGVVGVDPSGMSALTAAHPLIPLKNAQTLVTIPSESVANFAVMGTMGTPSHLEYASYNPRDVTHDHIFHDHGELPSGVEVTKETLRAPPKVSYNRNGFRINGGTSKRHQVKYPKTYSKPTSPTSDFSYYENIYAPKRRPKKVPKSTITPHYDTSEPNLDDFRPIPRFNFKDNRNAKMRNPIPNNAEKQLIPNFQLQQASVPAPFSVSSTIVHDYAHKNHASGSRPTSSTTFSKYRDPLIDFKDSYTNDFDYDTFASSSNLYTTEDKNESHQGKSGKKSVSTQNISFGGQDHQSFVDHFSASSNSEVFIDERSPTGTEHENDFEDTTDVATPTPYTIKETSPAHPYYTAMALKALHGNQPEASNDNVQYANPPTQSTLASDSPITTTTSQPQYYKIQSTDAITPDQDFISETRQVKKHRQKKGESRQRYNEAFKELFTSGLERPGSQHPQNKYIIIQTTDSGNVRANLKYGDKI